VNAAPGRRRAPRRAIDGLLLLDKPAGSSSNQALQRVRRLLDVARAGHAGTLDPLATGMLPIGLGRATKVCGALLDSAKTYRARLELGSATTTGDSEGDVIATAPVPVLGLAETHMRLQELVGDQEQVPPMYSALKHRGRPLYEFAREGLEVERLPRLIHIHRLTLLDCAARAIEFDVECSKGTYVRVLGEELARRLGTVGHLASLRRLWVEPFQDEPMISLADVEAWSAGAGPDERPPWLLPIDRALVAFGRLDLDAASARALRQGKVVAVAPKAGTFRIYGPSDEFLGLVDVDGSGLARVRRLFVGAPAD
jgi:tRNA pseudouridine55 synthase